MANGALEVAMPTTLVRQQRQITAEAHLKVLPSSILGSFVASLGVIAPNANKTYLIDATPDIIAQLDLLSDVRTLSPNGVDRAPMVRLLATNQIQAVHRAPYGPRRRVCLLVLPRCSSPSTRFVF